MLKPLLLALLLACLSSPGLAQDRKAARDLFDPDANGDGRVTLQEVKAAETNGMISRLDRNGDGAITRAEFKPLVDFAKAQSGDAAGRRAAGLFLALDANRDGQVTKNEREAAAERRFRMVDANNDGWLSKGEMLQMGQMRQRAN